MFIILCASSINPQLCWIFLKYLNVRAALRIKTGTIIDFYYYFRQLFINWNKLYTFTNVTHQSAAGLGMKIVLKLKTSRQRGRTDADEWLDPPVAGPGSAQEPVHPGRAGPPWEKKNRQGRQE